jgi:hypothetical protein
MVFWEPLVKGQNWFFHFLRTAGHGSELVPWFSEKSWLRVNTGSLILENRQWRVYPISLPVSFSFKERECNGKKRQHKTSRTPYIQLAFSTTYDWLIHYNFTFYNWTTISTTKSLLSPTFYRVHRFQPNYEPKLPINTHS